MLLEEFLPLQICQKCYQRNFFHYKFVRNVIRGISPITNLLEMLLREISSIINLLLYEFLPLQICQKCYYKNFFHYKFVRNVIRGISPITNLLEMLLREISSIINLLLYEFLPLQICQKCDYKNFFHYKFVRNVIRGISSITNLLEMLLEEFLPLQICQKCYQRNFFHYKFVRNVII